MIECVSHDTFKVSPDINDLVEYFERGETIRFTFKHPSDSDFNIIDSFLARILSRNNKLYLLETVISILRELVLNAAKANYKRIYFSEKGLDINDPRDYDRGMTSFRNLISKQQVLQDKLKNNDYWIRITCIPGSTEVIIETENNAVPTKQELQRIEERIDKAQNIKSFSHTYDAVFDTLEGAGLGLLLTILLMKNAGLDHEHFKLICQRDSFLARLTIPRKIVKTAVTVEIKNSIIREIETLPTLPEYIIELKALCNNPDISIEELSERISKDPSLAADVLRLANSAGFITSKKIETISEAVIIIGLKNLDMILTIASAKKILQGRYRRFQMVWNHCNQCAVYARLIAMETGFRDIADNAFMAGILHDIGSIVLLTVDDDLTEKILHLLNRRKAPSSTVLEEITIGISHAEIGNLIAEKWNFPDYIIDVITYHHSPLKAEEKFKDLVMVVYLANILCNIEHNNMQFSFIEEQALDAFGISDKTAFEQFHNRIKQEYDQVSAT